MKAVAGALLLTMLIAVAPATAECLPTPCFVESFVVESCVRVDEEAGRRGKEQGLTAEQVAEIVSRQPGLLIHGKPVQSRAVSSCAEPTKPRLTDGQSVRPYLVRGKSCSDFKTGALIEGFVSEPCCDVFPAWSIECVMLIETAEDTMGRLALLHGTWKGSGKGNYPTIEPFHYDETLRFELDSGYPLIHYEQKTILRPSGEASHWESGFLRALPDGSVEISNSQDSGRVEVLTGRLEEPDGGFEGLVLVLDNLVLDHDPRLVRTRRSFALEADTLSYVVYMSTHTTPEPLLQQHLAASLERVATP
jgi:hypothetical protein